MSFIIPGKFKGASGKELPFKISLDAWDADDWYEFAHLVEPLLDPFTSVHGVPTGGNTLAAMLEPYAIPAKLDQYPLVVDDVWTTGGSMRKYVEAQGLKNWQGFVVFARGPTPPNVKCLFRLELGD